MATLRRRLVDVKKGCRVALSPSPERVFIMTGERNGALAVVQREGHSNQYEEWSLSWIVNVLPGHWDQSGEEEKITYGKP